MMELNGGDVIVDIDNITIEPRPSRRDILKVVSTIGRYIDGWNNPTLALHFPCACAPELYAPVFRTRGDPRTVR